MQAVPIDTIHAILKKHWGYTAFRPQQEEIINTILSGRDTLALLPTGGGKSICYQVPALAQEGICLVVSPLIALMKDQVENLKKRGVGALVIYGGMQKKDIIRTLENARQDYFKFLYVSPERLETSLFKEYLPALSINLIAVDEAHCISQWGYDFRPAYLRIAALREELPGVPVLAVTASATPLVQKDICKNLLFKQPVIFQPSLERPNLSYSVFAVASKMNKLLDVVSKVPGSGIVYCKSRKRTTEVAALLQLHGVSASFYHAGLPQEERTQRQQDWVDNKIRMIVCTNAFGMGIDKPDVRLVVHADVPDCLENYYQEAGRCGRDGKKAYAVLLYDNTEIEDLENLHTIRFPSVETIKLVYEALINYLQIPVYKGQDQRYDFNFETFIRNFHLTTYQALYSLQALESDGWLEYNEKAFTPTTLVFTTSKQLLYEFYTTYPDQENLLVSLLRAYEGIFDFPAFISEPLLAKLVQKEESEVKEQLRKLTSYGIIQYTPQNDTPQIIFRKNRVTASDLKINTQVYQKRKDVFIARIQKMVEYIKTVDCRSGYISDYFGQPAGKDCGFCNNCLQKKKPVLPPAEVEAIATAILTHVSKFQVTPTELFKQLDAIKKDNGWHVLRFLQAERKIFITPDGRLSLFS